MDCRTCQPTLIDLLYGELATDAAEQAHAHLKHCTSCRSAYDKLAKGRQLAQQMSLLEPPQAVGARLLQMAEQHARTAASQAQPARKQAPPWQSLIEFIGHFAMARQVGMATIMLLIVAVGLWSLPQLERGPVADGGTVVNPEPSGEAAPSIGVQPAQPLDLQVDLRSGRIRSKDEPSEVAADELAGTASPATVGEGVRAGRSDAQASEELARLGDPARTRDSASAKPALRARRSAESKKSSADNAAPVVERGNYGLDDKGAGAGPSGRAVQERAEQRAFPASAAPEPAPTPTASKPAPAAAPQPPADMDLEGSLAGMKESAGSLRAESSVAAEAPAQAPAKYKSSANSAASDCRASFAGYERILEAAPESAQAGEALLAMARCLNDRGERARARALLERAARNPYVAERAKAMLAKQPPADTRSNPYKR